MKRDAILEANARLLFVTTLLQLFTKERHYFSVSQMCFCQIYITKDSEKRRQINKNVTLFWKLITCYYFCTTIYKEISHFFSELQTIY